MTESVRPRDLIHLRHSRSRRRFSALELPPSGAEAYNIAAATLGLMARPVAAWKLGATTPGTRRAFATERVYFGALVTDEVWSLTDGREPPLPPQFRGEAEIAFRLSADITPTDPAPADPDAVFDAWAPVIEAPYSCVDNISELGLRALLMDRCAAGALYLGDAREEIHASEIGALIEILVDGAPVASGEAGSSLLMPPLSAAMEFLRVAAEAGVTVRRGQWISTGGITPCVDLPSDRTVSLRFGGAEIFRLKFGTPASEATP